MAGGRTSGLKLTGGVGMWMSGGRRAGGACEAVRRLEELAAVLDAGRSAKMAIRCGLLVLWPPQGHGDGKGDRAAIELEFEDAGDVIGTLLASLGAMGLDEVG